MTVPEELPDERTDERTDTHVRCRICGKWVPFEKSRLFWGPEGTIRTCRKGTVIHKA